MTESGGIEYVDFEFVAQSEKEVPENIHSQVAITLRGAFGISLKKLVCCSQSKVCSKCLLRNRCPYMLIFEGLAPENRSQMTLYPYIPQPFIFRLLGDSYIYDKTLRFGLRLFGEAVDLYPYVIVAIRNMLERGLGKARQRFELQLVTDSEKEIYTNVTQSISSPTKRFIDIESFLSGQSRNVNVKSSSVRLISQTPVHIRTDGRWNRQPSLFDLAKAALRRIKIMSYFYGNYELDIRQFSSVLFDEMEQAEIKNCAYNIWSFARYSSRQRRRVPLSGVFLDIHIDEASSQLMKLFDIASKLNLGKYTSFGFGQIICEA